MTSQHENSIVKAIQRDPGCTFLLAKLILDDLGKSATKGEIMKRLECLPQGLEQAYRLTTSRLLQRLDPHQISLAKSILALIVAALWPLTVTKIQHAYAAECKHSSNFDENLLSQPELQILEVLNGLMSIVNDRVSLIHLSLLEFLTRPGEDWICQGDQDILALRMDPEASHREFAFACVRYLQSVKLEVPTLGAKPDPNTAQRHPLGEYATKNVFEHAYLAGLATPLLSRQINDFLRSKASAAWLETLAVLSCTDETFAQFSESELNRLVSWLGSADFRLDEIRRNMQAHIHQELNERRQKFGEEDPRTE